MNTYNRHSEKAKIARIVEKTKTKNLSPGTLGYIKGLSKSAKYVLFGKHK